MADMITQDRQLNRTENRPGTSHFTLEMSCVISRGGSFAWR